MHTFILLAQAIDPVEIGEALGEAQSIQQVLAIIIAALISVVLALCYFYLRERKSWNAEKVDIIKRWGDAKLEWEKERGAHAGRLTELAESTADGREALMREMLELSLRIEKALSRLAAWKEARGDP